MEDLAFLFHHLVEDRFRAVPKKEQRQNANIAECVFISPRLPDRLAGVKLLVVGADEEDKEGCYAFAFVGLVDEELEIVRVESARSDVAERVVLRESRERFARGEGHMTHVGG